MPAVYEFLMDESVKIQILDYQGNPSDAKGIVTEINPPEIKQKMDQDLRIGESGAVSRPMGYEAMEASIKMKGISEQFFNYVATAQALKKQITVQVTGKGSDRYSSDVQDLKLTLKGFVSRLPVFSMKAGEKSELDMALAVNAIGQKVAGTTVYLEPGANKYEINGINQWS